MIAFTAFIMLFVLSFAAFIVSLVKEVDGTEVVTKYYSYSTRAAFNASSPTNSTLLTTANGLEWGTVPGPYDAKTDETASIQYYPNAKASTWNTTFSLGLVNGRASEYTC
jgi:hypothetical protein